MPDRPIRWLLFFAAVATPTAAQTPVGLPSLAEVMSRDAQLHDLSFVDGRHGWAVGDRGVILRTVDGGRRWTVAESGVELPLYGVDFINHREGWAVGGFMKPYTHSSHAVVLKTDDGGATWRRMPADTLPLLRRVQFFDEHNGAAAGAGTDFSPSGLFQTDNGGRTWRPLPTAKMRHWTAASFLAPGVGIAGGDAGEVVTLARHEVQSHGALAGEPRGVRGAALVAPAGGWIVGDGGLVLATTDLGKTWRPPAAPPPIDTPDWRAIAVHGPRVWIAGSPGSVVLHSPDAGRSWRVQPTGSAAPLSSICFVDAQRGWAAGALGTILATDDGGRTWRVQRRGGERAGVLVLTPTPADAPLDLVATLAAAEGHLTAVEAPIASNDGEPLSQTAARLHEAAIASGATISEAGWRLTMALEEGSLARDPLLDRLNQRTGDRAMAILEEQLVARLRTLRPEMVLVTRQRLDQPSGVEQLLEQAAQSAIQAAADPSRHPRLSHSGLGPHRAQRLVVASPVDPHASPRVATGDFQPLLGTSPAHWVGHKRGLLTKSYRPPPEAIGWRVIAEASPATTTGRDPMAGVAVARGGGARRPAAAPAAGELAALRDVAQKRRHMRALLATGDGNEAWRSQALNLTSGLDPDSGAELLYQLADSYRREGRVALAADTYYLLARRYTDHPLADSALVWLLRYYASAEVAHAAITAAPRQLDQPPLANVTGPSPPAALEREPLEIQSTGGVLPLVERLDRALQLGEYLEQARPAMYADPAVRFPMAAAERGLGRDKQSEQRLVVLTKRAIAPAWRHAAEAEKQIAKPAVSTRQPPDLPAARCRLVTGRPLLDGAFDEKLWQEAAPITLGDAFVRVARDEEFLYLAIDADFRTAGNASDGPRRRDADLSGSDHFTLRFDTDRDYTSSLRLSIDSSGRTADHCWGDQPWDPAWYVAAKRRPDRWTAEAAIPLAALAPVAPTKPWALAIERHSPGAPIETWTGAAGPSAPHGFGLLWFE